MTNYYQVTNEKTGRQVTFDLDHNEVIAKLDDFTPLHYPDCETYNAISQLLYYQYLKQFVHADTEIFAFNGEQVTRSLET